MKLINYYLLSITIIILFFTNCANPDSDSSRTKSTINDCFNVNDKQACFDYFFSWDGPVANGPESEHGKISRIEDPNNIIILCEELRKTKNKRTASGLFALAVFNNAPCVCDYAISEYENSIEGDGVNEYYGKFLMEYNCNYNTDKKDHIEEQDK